MLGVGSSKSDLPASSEIETDSASANLPDSSRVSEPPQASTDSAKKAAAKASEEGDFMGFKTIPSPEEETPLPSMFSSTSQSQDPQAAKEAKNQASLIQVLQL